MKTTTKHKMKITRRFRHGDKVTYRYYEDLGTAYEVESAKSYWSYGYSPYTTIRDLETGHETVVDEGEWYYED